MKNFVSRLVKSLLHVFTFLAVFLLAILWIHFLQVFYVFGDGMVLLCATILTIIVGILFMILFNEIFKNFPKIKILAKISLWFVIFFVNIFFVDRIMPMYYNFEDISKWEELFLVFGFYIFWGLFILSVVIAILLPFFEKNHSNQ